MDPMMEMIKSEIGLADIEGNKNHISNLLLQTRRQGVDKLLEHMDKQGFFTAPCSTNYHLAKDGGLAEHSLNVYRSMVTFYNAQQEFTVDSDTIKIVSLLHDLGKMGHHNKPNYVKTSLLKSGKAPAKPFETNKELLYIPHEIESIAIAQRFIELSEEEEYAILYHNAMYGDMKYSYSGKETPLSLLLHWADMWSARVIEKEGE